MRHRASMRHLLCMRTPVRFGVADGAIDATSAAVGKVSEKQTVPGQNPTRFGPKVDKRAGVWNVRFVPIAEFCRSSCDVCFVPEADIGWRLLNIRFVPQAPSAEYTANWSPQTSKLLNTNLCWRQ